MIDVQVEDIDVYRSMFGVGADMTPLATINQLLTLLVPPEALVARSAPKGNSRAPATGPTSTSSSRRRRSRRRSAADGAALSNSGA
jgi:hypothetical protein